MYSFLNDYSEGAHLEVLDALIKSNNQQTVGYGNDEYCKLAKEDIYKRIDTNNADIHFLVGGTQTNLTFIAYALRNYQAVIACDEGHINVHETGAVESIGRKVLTRPHINGKVTPDMIQDIVDSHPDEHMVQPKMVYISQTTELGTYYTLDELKAIYQCAHQNNLYLFIDGARLGSALVLDDAPSMKEMAMYSDAFYIGGTKMGAMFGEALVILNDELKKDFRYELKQKGGMLAKGRLLGIQFHALLKDDLYERIGTHENQMADLIRQAFNDKGIPLYLPSSTNQIFVDLTNEQINKIEKEFMITHLKKLDENTQRIRLVTSWATPKEAIDSFCEMIKKL